MSTEEPSEADSEGSFASAGSSSLPAAMERVFPRSPAIIGRDVEKCQPSESVHVVNEIIDSFRAGKQDNATFWINLKGRKYFALRDPEGNYRGVLEASQDITEIKKNDPEIISSKIFSPGSRLGYVLANDEATAKLFDAKTATTTPIHQCCRR